VTRTRWVWLNCGLLYAVFFGWYTSFGGPLTEQEIDQYLVHFEQRGIAPQQQRMLEQFMRADTGDDFAMVNVIDMHETPLQVDGVEPGESSSDVLGRYMQYMYPALFARASHPVFFGDAANRAMDLMNAPGMERWSQGALMRYRSRRDVVQMVLDPAFTDGHKFKLAAIQRTISYPTQIEMNSSLPPHIAVLVLLVLLASLAQNLAHARDRSQFSKS